MAKKAVEGGKRLTLADFYRYLTDTAHELETCHAELEQVRVELDRIFRQELEGWKKTFGFCFGRLMAQRHELPPAFVQRIDRVEQEELARIRDEIAALTKEIEAIRAQEDTLMSKGQTETEALRTSNPEINEREEKLKAMMVKYQDQYADAFEQIEALEAGLGWLTHWGQIRRLRKAQREAKQRQDRTLKQLRNVRQNWLDKVQQVGDTQAELREQWQQATVRVAEAESRRDYLTANTADLGQQAALQRILQELDADPGVPGELGDGLREMVGRNAVRLSYEAGLRAAAEGLGLTQGISKGTVRFGQSVSNVVDEQRRYNLRQVQVEIPQWIVNVNDTWSALSSRIADEAYLGNHPTEFAQIIKEYISDRISDEIIQRMFETMGDALNKATSAWK